MDESYLTGEPFKITKTCGSTVISGAINGEAALIIRTTQRAADSRYAKIMEVMRESEAKRPQLRRLGDQLGALYTPVSLTVALSAPPASVIRHVPDVQGAISRTCSRFTSSLRFTRTNPAPLISSSSSAACHGIFKVEQTPLGSIPGDGILQQFLQLFHRDTGFLGGQRPQS